MNYAIGSESRRNAHMPDLFRRHPGNPLLTAADWPYAAHSVFNPGATRLSSGETLLMVRVEDVKRQLDLPPTRIRIAA